MLRLISLKNWKRQLNNCKLWQEKGVEKIYLWDDESVKSAADRPSVTAMLCDDGKIHKGVLVIPGGGYGNVCESTEGTPIARGFNELGFHAFILDYRTAPSRWPEPQLDAMRAMKLIRKMADKWRVDGEKLSVCGFSAGAHLAGSLGILCNNLDCGKDLEKFSHLPYAMILCYGVLSFEPWSHQGTCRNLLGENFTGDVRQYSLVENVTSSTPPAFLMHTICDQAVSYRNSMLFAEAMAAAEVPCELKLDYWGQHGMLLGKNTLDVSSWQSSAVGFIRTLEAMESDADYIKRYTNAYQSAQN